MSMLERKFVFQFIRASDGVRSDPFVSTIPAFVKQDFSLDDEDQFYVLVLVAVPDSDDVVAAFQPATKFPLMKISSFRVYAEGLENA